MANDPSVNLCYHAHDVGNHVSVGKITFPQSPSRLQAWRTVDGLALTLPMEVTFPMSGKTQAAVQLSRLRAIVFQNRTEIGIAEDLNTYSNVSYGGHQGALILRLPAHVVRHVETFRSGGPVTFEFQVVGEVSRLLLSNDSGALVPSQATPLHGNGQPSVTYARETWVGMLNATGFGDNVVVEIPLPPAPNGDWAPVWKAVATARDALKHNGGTAWKSAILECRHALEAWQKIEKEDQGPGWKSPTTTERADRTREQRLDNLRWHLLQCAHEAAHTPADKWTREDASLILAALAGLLAIRNP